VYLVVIRGQDLFRGSTYRLSHALSLESRCRSTEARAPADSNDDPVKCTSSCANNLLVVVDNCCRSLDT
jgi:hypothetical protein